MAYNFINRTLKFLCYIFPHLTINPAKKLALRLAFLTFRGGENRTLSIRTPCARTTGILLPAVSSTYCTLSLQSVNNKIIKTQ